MKSETLNPYKKEILNNRTLDIGAVYEKYAAALKGFIRKKVTSEEDSEDILQNVFYRLAKTDLAENPIGQISGWLYSVARNQIIDRSRKNKEESMPANRDKEGERFLEELTDILHIADGDPESDYLKSIVWIELEEALNELPQVQKTVFELTELQGVSFKEISEATGLPVNTLISRKRYAVLHLRERLKDLYDDFITDK